VLELGAHVEVEFVVLETGDVDGPVILALHSDVQAD